MARKHREVRFYRDGDFFKFITPAEANDGLESGALEPVFEQRGMEVRQVGVQARGGNSSSSSPTPCHITAEESTINALGKGLRLRGQPLLPGEKERFGEAELKIRWWPRTRERKATPKVISDVAGPFCTLPLCRS